MKQYSKPTIVKVGNPLYAKHGSSNQSYPFIRNNIDGVTISELVKKFGSPLFVFSKETLQKKFREAKKAIGEIYPNFQFGWSYKTNYLNAICQVFHDEGAIAEVVSDFEYEKARALGIKGHNIIFNGPYKSKKILELAIKENAQIHIDNFDEMMDIEEIAKSLNKQVKVGIRINFNAGIYPSWSRFGFNLESGQAKAAIDFIIRSSNLKISGIHSHIGTFVTDANAYKRALEKTISFMHEVEKLSGYDLEFIDIGGGFASKNHLKTSYQAPEINVPTINDYAKAIAKPLQSLLKRRNPPKLILELGRHLVDEAGFLITSIVADKFLADSRRSYVLDAGVNLLYTSSWYKFKIELEREVEGIAEPTILFGPLCMNIDVVDEAILLPRLQRFERLIISPVGAYNITQSMQFIQYRPAVVMIDEKSQVKIIRKAENLDYVNELEQ
ncbi:MAG: alanine racemase [Rickettsiales bacterium]|nr:alanine racemase [Rickettsiales bacterium]